MEIAVIHFSRTASCGNADWRKSIANVKSPFSVHMLLIRSFLVILVYKNAGGNRKIYYDISNVRQPKEHERVNYLFEKFKVPRFRLINNISLGLQR